MPAPLRSPPEPAPSKRVAPMRICWQRVSREMALKSVSMATARIAPSVLRATASTIFPPAPPSPIIMKPGSFMGGLHFFQTS